MDKENLLKKVATIKSAIEIKSPQELKKATEYSMRGVRDVILGEKAFRTDLIVFAIANVVACVSHFCFNWITTCECALLIYVVFMVLIGEIINTAIEATIDRISTDYHELSRRAKDIGSAIVFVAFFGAGIVWLIVFLDVILRMVF